MLFFSQWKSQNQPIKLPMLVLKQQINSSPSFASFFIVIIHNSSVYCKLIHFLFWIKGSHQSSNFETFECSGKNLPNSSSHFPNHKSVFSQILRHYSISPKKTPLYFFHSKNIHFAQKEPIIKFTFLRLQRTGVKIRQISHINFEMTSQFHFKFFIIL